MIEKYNTINHEEKSKLKIKRQDNYMK